MNEYAIRILEFEKAKLENDHEFLKKHRKQMGFTKPKDEPLFKNSISQLQQAIDQLSNSKVIAEGEIVQTQVGVYIDGKLLEIYKLNGTKVRLLQIDK